MREIKFRAWDIEGKTMIPWDGMYGLTRCDEPEAVAVHVAAGDQLYLMPEQIHLMQFTGCHDINGKEIYVGDIVSHRIYRPHPIKSLPHFYSAMLPDIARYGWRGDGPDLGFIIHGNIYENPELTE